MTLGDSTFVMRIIYGKHDTETMSASERITAVVTTAPVHGCGGSMTAQGIGRIEVGHLTA